eukprot:UN08222
MFNVLANNANSNYYGFYCLCYHFTTFCYTASPSCDINACNALASPFEYGNTIFFAAIAALVLLICSIIECCSSGCQNKSSR